MKTLGIDIGSSSVKAGILRNGQIIGATARSGYLSHFDGVRAEVDSRAILKAIAAAVGELKGAQSADLIAFSVMAPSWVAMDKRGRAITPIVTHQDRRSIDIAKELESRVGKKRLLSITGNRPFPGGISSTTCAWFVRHHPGLMRRADLVGHLNTFLIRHMTGGRFTDPSNASFMGLYETLKLGGWNLQLCKAVGISPRILPDVIPGNCIAGKVTPQAAREMGLRAGIPVLASVMDGSAAMLSTGAKVGQLLNVAGSTDVLALCTDRPRPHERLLTRALGVGKKWVSVATLAAAGSAISWMHGQFFRELPDHQFQKLISGGSGSVPTRFGRNRTLQRSAPNIPIVHFDPYLAGDRTSIEQRHAAFTNLTLSTTREDMLASVIEALEEASAARLPLLKSGGTPIRRNVHVTGGVQHGLGKLLYRRWGKGWVFKAVEEATLKGLAALIPE